MGRLLPLAPRIALRDTARNRTAAAPAISAVMAAVAGSLAVGVVLIGVSERARDSYRVLGRPGDVFVLSFGRTVPPDVVATLRSTMPVQQIHRINLPSCGGGGAGSCVVGRRVPTARACPTTSWGATRPRLSSAPPGATPAATALATATSTSGAWGRPAA